MAALVAIESVRTSKTLQRILGAILAIGNFLNNSKVCIIISTFKTRMQYLCTYTDYKSKGKRKNYALTHSGLLHIVGSITE
jgi:hypothetical protein